MKAFNSSSLCWDECAIVHANVAMQVKDPPEDFVVLNKAYEGVKVKPRRQWQ